MRVCTALALLIPLTACGSEASSGTPDAKPMSDAAVASVMEVTCPATVPLTVTADPGQSTMMFTYTPSNAAIPVGSIVKFMMPSVHDVGPSLQKPADPALKVGLGATKCFKFTKAGTFNFVCTQHSFAGSVTVQ
jgi:plastocyanin